MTGLFTVVAGPRLGGKTTIAGTLKGKTKLLQAAVLETGSRSAVKIAQKLGNTLVVETFSDLLDFHAKVTKAAGEDWDHIYIDGFSAINDMRWAMADIQKAYKKNNFEAYGLHGNDMREWCRELKKLCETGKNIFLTAAMKIKDAKEGNSSNEPDVVMEAKGNIGPTELTKLGENVVSVLELPGENGVLQRVLVTKTYNKWPGRIDGVLDSDNPQFVEPDLSIVLALARGEVQAQGEAA